MHFNTEVVDAVSNSKGQMSGLLLKRVDTGEQSTLDVKGLFYGIGHTPNSQVLEGQIELDNADYVLVKEGTAETSVEGVFAAGDIQVLSAFIFYSTRSYFYVFDKLRALFEHLISMLNKYAKGSIITHTILIFVVFL